jgi:hypothetical protein
LLFCPAGVVCGFKLLIMSKRVATLLRGMRGIKRQEESSLLLLLITLRVLRIMQKPQIKI